MIYLFTFVCLSTKAMTCIMECVYFYLDKKYAKATITLQKKKVSETKLFFCPFMIPGCYVQFGYGSNSFTHLSLN